MTRDFEAQCSLFTYIRYKKGSLFVNRTVQQEDWGVHIIASQVQTVQRN